MGSYPASEYVSGHIGLRSFHWHTRNLSDRCKKLLIFFIAKFLHFAVWGVKHEQNEFLNAQIFSKLNGM